MSKAQDLIAQISPLWEALKAEVNAGAPTPTTNFVKTAADLTAALKAGGTYQLASGNYVGNFFAKVPGTTLFGPRDAVIAPLDPSTPPMTVLAKGVKMAGFTTRNGLPDRETFVVGDPAATTVDAQPADVLLEDLFVEAGPNGGHRGFSLHGVNLTVRRARVTGFWEAGRDSQAVWIHNGPGPYLVEDSHLEASGENILTGGSFIAIPNCVPSNITIRRNTFFKPDSWRTNGATVKNSIELKAALHVLIEKNVVDGCWRSGQDGTPILFSTRNQDGKCPWVIVDDVTFVGNEMKRCSDSFAMSILGSDDTYPSQQTKTLVIEHNLWRDARSGFKIGNGVTEGLIIRNNTIPMVKGHFMTFYDTRQTRVTSKLVFVDNVVASGAYGIHSAEFGLGVPTLNAWTPGAAFTGNVIEQSPDRTIQYPAGNTILPAGQLLSRLDPQTLKTLDGVAGY